MADRQHKARSDLLPRALARTRGSVRAAMLLERGWPLVLPLLVTISLFVSLSWFGVFRVVPDWLRFGLLTAFALAAFVALFPLRHFQSPSPAEIDRRIEASNHLEHAPVLTQTDTLSPASQDAFAQALWHEHRKRMASRLNALSGDLPRAGVPERDPWALRAVAPLLLFIALGFSSGPLGGTLTDAFRSHAASSFTPVRVDAWVTPPTYTGKPPIFLTVQQQGKDVPAFRVPTGTTIAVRVAGASGDESLIWLDSHTGSETAIAEDDGLEQINGTATAHSTSKQFSDTLTRDGMLTLSGSDVESKSWAFAIIPDAPPVIRFVGEPRRAVNGALELTYEIEDDYGASAARALINPAAPADPEAVPLYGAPDMPLALPRQNGDGKSARTSKDLSEHPWAGTAVTLTLEAEDGAGQKSKSESRTITLPERPFANPLAKALVEQRRLLALDANAKPFVLALMDAITLRPEDTIENLAHYLGIMSARSRLKLAYTEDALRDVADYLWNMALAIEDGALSAAERRLKQAQEALKQAIENGASDEELDQLMAELREAMREFLRQFAERAAQDPNMAMQMPDNAQEMRPGDLERMMDQIENLARSGARDQAMDMLQQLQDMMNNLQAGRQQQPGGEQGQMQQQMNELGNLMRRQQETMNETFRLDQQQQSEQQMSPEEFEEAMRQLQQQQGELQQQLQQLQEGLEGMGLQPGEGFGEAGDAMGRAEGALGEGQGEGAVSEQGQALEALRRGAQDMMQQLQAMQGEGQDGQGEQGGRQQSSGRDPLGRPRATTGPDFGDSVEVPDVIDAQRARQILEEIRRRLGNALSPELERNYLERLLELR